MIELRVMIPFRSSQTNEFEQHAEKQLAGLFLQISRDADWWAPCISMKSYIYNYVHTGEQVNLEEPQQFIDWLSDIKRGQLL